MYAVFQSGGKQHQVEEGNIIRVEKLDAKVGELVDFNQVMMISHRNDIRIGFPYLTGSKVVGEVLSHSRDKKIVIVKFRRRKHSRKRQGHRQWFTAVKIKSILFKELGGQIYGT